MMIWKQFVLQFLYAQVSVFGVPNDAPFSQWTTRHYNQGFAWRPDSASFRMPIEAGYADVNFIVAENLDSLPEDAIRIIEVPFTVPSSETIEVATTTDAVKITVPRGRYSLRFEVFGPDAELRVRVNFVLSYNDVARFRVIRADPELRLEGDLLTTASPAR